jgi:membrane protein involved in colicin uptake
MLDQLEREHEKFMAEWDVRIAQDQAQREQERAQRAQERAQEKAKWDAKITRMEAKHVREKIERDAKIARIKEKIEMPNNLLIQNGLMNPNPMSEERPGSSLDFFTRPSP